MDPLENFSLAGVVAQRGLNIVPGPPRPGRYRNSSGDGPFARLVMPQLPAEPGVYIWRVNGNIVYVGQTRTTLRKRLGSVGYSTISDYNTYAREPGKRNGGQETNCRINAFANAALAQGGEIEIWYRVTNPDESGRAESKWMDLHGVPPWNRRDERT
jgi:hypothetical protein